MGLEIFRLDDLRIVVDARGAVYPVPVVIGKDDRRKDGRKGRHFGQNDLGIHTRTSS